MSPEAFSPRPNDCGSRCARCTSRCTAARTRLAAHYGADTRCVPASPSRRTCSATCGRSNGTASTTIC
jgi:hypothetical protein